MKTRPIESSFRKSLFLIVLFFGAIFIFGTVTLLTAHAQTGGVHLSSVTTIMRNGKAIADTIINGSPTPPPGYVARSAGALPESNSFSSLVSLNVPSYDWVFGCSSVSGAMIAAYYDRNGYSNIYTGPTNGGVMPMDNSIWGHWYDGTGAYYPNLPLAASHQGVDGRATKGSIDDYWVSSGSKAQDPYITGGWGQHTWGDAIGDYMKTSQSAFGNFDGATNFYTWMYDAGPLTCADMAANGIQNNDGTYGRKLFYEARGYTVTDCYSQYTDDIVSGGFTYAQYKAEIDAGHPVMINLLTGNSGHTVVGVGYDNTSNTIYIHTTWDYSYSTMTWGGSWEGMQMRSVSIVNLLPPPAAFNKSGPPNGSTCTVTNPTLSWGASSGAASYQYCYGTATGCTNWISVGTSTSIGLTGLINNQVYYWQVRAVNTTGNTLANSGAYWSFTTMGTTPAPFGKVNPGNGGKALPNQTLSWQASCEATTYSYCINTTNTGTCSGSWTPIGGNTSVLVTNQPLGTYFWQVRASDSINTLEADAGTWWSYTVVTPKVLFLPLICK